MTLGTRVGGIGACVLSLLAGQAALGVDDCCSRTEVTRSFQSELREGTLCSTLWTATHRTDGKFCFPIGTGYACGIARSLVVGQEYTLSASVTVGTDGAEGTVGVSTSHTVSEESSHTAGPCQSCQFFASYGNATVIEWKVQKFCVWGDSEYTRTAFYNHGGAPTIQPCCEENTDCPGCRTAGDEHDGEQNGCDGANGDEYGGFPGLGSEPFPMEGEPQAERGGAPHATIVVDLRVPDFVLGGGLPAWHPMNSPGTTLATLNGWQKRSIMRDIAVHETIDPIEVTELAVIDVDGSSHIFDLLAEPGGLVPCPSDSNVDGLLDLADVSLFINYFLFGDEAADLDYSGTLDLGDVGLFTSGFMGGCP